MAATLSGSIIARYKPDRRQSTNEVQINTVNPDSASDWRQFGLFQGSTAEITGRRAEAELRTTGTSSGWSFEVDL
jgi:hypothetical protein